MSKAHSSRFWLEGVGVAVSDLLPSRTEFYQHYLGESPQANVEEDSKLIQVAPGLLVLISPTPTFPELPPPQSQSLTPSSRTRRPPQLSRWLSTHSGSCSRCCSCTSAPVHVLTTIISQFIVLVISYPPPRSCPTP